MFSVRLVIVMAIYVFLVAAALVTITVVFSLLSRQAMNEQVFNLAHASMSVVRRATVDEIDSYESGAFEMTMMLARLGMAAPYGTTGKDLADYVTAWAVLTIPQMALNSSFLSSFEMWLDVASDVWYMTGCNRQTALCTLYDASANTTQTVTYRYDSVSSPVDLSTAATVAGTPEMYPRYLGSIALQADFYPDWWGPLYYDYATTYATHTCKGTRVAKTIDYFYCTAFTTVTTAGGTRKKCTHLVGITVAANNAGSTSASDFEASSTIYLVSPLTVDNVGGICDPPADVGDVISDFRSSCKEELLTDCPAVIKLGKPYVYTVLAHEKTNNVAIIVADKAPHSFFFASINHSQDVAIAISVVMIVVVVLMTIIISTSIVIPISYICASMKNAANLTYEKRMAPITKYTIFSEVKQLCASYLDLRQALKDLKAYMPQGLLIGPEGAMDSTSILSALMGGGRYLSGDEDEEYPGDEGDSDDDEEDEELLYQMGGRAGGFSNPETSTSGTPSSQPPVEMATRPSVVASTIALTAATTRVPGRTQDMPEDPPLPGHRRSTVYSEGLRGQQGIVSIVPVSTTDEAFALNAEFVGRADRRKSSHRAAAANVSPTAGAKRPSGHVKLPPTAETSSRHFRSRTGYSSGTTDSSRIEGASLQLNRMVYNGAVNKFRNVNATLVCMRFSFKYVDEHSLEAEVSLLMAILIRVILRFGGVIEVFRPDVIVVSFGAHATVSQHTQRAVAAAMTITKKLTVEQRARSRIAVDTGSFYCGICGASGRISPVLFGDRFDAAIELLRYDLGLGRLIVTDRVALCLPGDFVVPFDYLVSLRDRSQGTQLFMVLNPAKRNKAEFRDSVMAFRQAYALASVGNYRDALEIVSRGGHFDPELASYCVATFKYLMTMNPPRPRYCRFQLPSYEPLGVVVKEKAPKYQHNQLHLQDLEAEEEAHISINFGFGGGSSTGTAGNVNPPGQSGSNVFGEMSAPNVLSSGENMQRVRSEAMLRKSQHTAARLSSDSDGINTVYQFRSRDGSHDTTTAPRSFAMRDDRANSPTESAEANGSFGAVRSVKQKSYAASVVRGGETSCTDSVEEGLPLTFKDHKNEEWHRFPTMIGSGAFAEVYKAISGNGSLMALKCIHLAATNVQLADVVSEVNTACKLFSDFIVNHSGWAHVGSYMIIIMDYMPGGSLHTAMSAFPNGMTLQVARRYASDALRGLAYLHRNGVVHADLKPQNILLATDGGCRLSDFGSSVTKANARTAGGDVFHLRGTPSYMSPEVARGDAPSMRSDMWSFGITLYEMLTGRQPWVMKRGTALPPIRGVSFLSVATVPDANAATPATPTTSASAAGSPVGFVGNVFAGKAASGFPSTHGDSVASSVVAAPFSPNSPQQPASASPPVEWVPVVGLSDVRFVQGIANGSVQVRVERKDLPTLESYQLISQCLREPAHKRPMSWESVDHSFFFSY